MGQSRWTKSETANVESRESRIVVGEKFSARNCSRILELPFDLRSLRVWSSDLESLSLAGRTCLLHWLLSRIWWVMSHDSCVSHCVASLPLKDALRNYRVMFTVRTACASLSSPVCRFVGLAPHPLAANQPCWLKQEFKFVAFGPKLRNQRCRSSARLNADGEDCRNRYQSSKSSNQVRIVSWLAVWSDYQWRLALSGCLRWQLSGHRGEPTKLLLRFWKLH